MSDAAGNVYIAGAHLDEESSDAAGNVYIAGASAYSRRILAHSAQLERDALNVWYEDGEADAAAGFNNAALSFDIAECEEAHTSDDDGKVYIAGYTEDDAALLSYEARRVFWESGGVAATVDIGDCPCPLADSAVVTAGNVVRTSQAASPDAAGNACCTSQATHQATLQALSSDAAGNVYISDEHHGFFMTGLLEGDTEGVTLCEDTVILENRESGGVYLRGGLLGNSLEDAGDPGVVQCGGLQGTEILVDVSSRARE